jgi:pimeloyl-ACP methyl ester carboxylesterase
LKLFIGRLIDMSNLIKVADWAKTPRANIIFVHGLGGHAYDTWRRAPDDDSFWPLWLAEDVEGISVWTLAYAAPASNWLGTAMPLQDRVGNVRARLLATPSLQDAPITFICHSLGGLIVKQLLLDLHQQKDRSPESAALLDRVTQVVFMATPHTGSWQGTLLDRLRFLAWPSSIAYTLVANDPTLRSINVAYRGLADERRNVLRHHVFYETQATVAGVIVDEASADPGLPGDPPVAIDADHIQIVKPSDRSALQYVSTLDFVAKNLRQEEQEIGFKTYPLPPIKWEQPRNVAPKLIRIASIVFVVIVAYKGVQTLTEKPPDGGHNTIVNGAPCSTSSAGDAIGNSVNCGTIPSNSGSKP